MFPRNNKKGKNHEIPSLDQIKKREGQQEVQKKASPDFFRKQIQDKSRKEVSQNDEERQRIVSFGKRRELVDITNKDTSHKEVFDQGKREISENISQNQTNEKKGIQEQLIRQEHERERAMQSRINKELGKANRNLEDDIRDIGQSIRLRELDRFSMTDHDMEMRGVRPEEFRRVSKELSSALKNSSPDELRVSAARKEFIEMAKKLGLIRPEG